MLSVQRLLRRARSATPTTPRSSPTSTDSRRGPKWRRARDDPQLQMWFCRQRDRHVRRRGGKASAACATSGATCGPTSQQARASTSRSCARHALAAFLRARHQGLDRPPQQRMAHHLYPDFPAIVEPARTRSPGTPPTANPRLREQTSSASSTTALLNDWVARPHPTRVRRSRPQPPRRLTAARDREKGGQVRLLAGPPASPSDHWAELTRKPDHRRRPRGRRPLLPPTTCSYAPRQTRASISSR